MQLIDYEEYIKENNLTSDERISYYTGWVRRFLKLNLSDRLTNNDKLKQFCAYLNADEEIEDWQRNQGMHAVEIYLNMYLANVKGNPGTGEHPDLLEVSEKMRTVLRLKHYA